MSDEHLHLLARRGPDVQQTLNFHLHEHHDGAIGSLVLYGSVLSMRGPSPLAQPLVSGRCDREAVVLTRICDSYMFSLHLLWNGEVYSGIEIEADGNDGLAVLLALAEEYTHAHAIVSAGDFLKEFSQRACAVLSRLNGPFAFVLYDSATQCMWFGRDFVGRRSLLTRTVMLQGCAAFCAASVASSLTADAVSGACAPDHSLLEEGASSDASESCQDQELSVPAENGGSWVEVPPSGMWLLQLGQLLHCTASPQPHHIPWITPPSPQLSFPIDNAVMCTDAVLSCLETSVRTRALVHSGSCGIGILFSGGLDCMIVAALAARCVPENTTIDLFNVAFDAAEAPDRESACAGPTASSLISPTFQQCFRFHRVVRLVPIHPLAPLRARCR